MELREMFQTLWWLAEWDHMVDTFVPPKFELHEPDIELLAEEISRLGPGGIPYEFHDNDFDLILPSLDPEEAIQMLVSRAGDFSVYYNGDRNKEWLRTPLVWDTGASSGLSPFRSDFLSDYEEVNLPVRAVGSIGQVVGRGTVL